MKTVSYIFALMLLAVPVMAANISILDDWVAPDGGIPAAFTVSAGTDRCLIVTIGYEVSGTSNVATCKLGTIPLTFIERSTVEQGNVSNHIEAWYLLDADMPGADSTLVFTYASSTPPAIGVSWMSYDNVDQTAPVDNSDTAYAANGTVIGVTITSVAGGATFFIAHQKSYDPDAVWTRPGEQFDITPSDNQTMTGADSLTTPSVSIAGEVTFSGASGRIVIFGVALAPEGAAPPAFQSSRRRKVLLGGE